MNWEIVTQGLDIIAFLLVTPEILGEERLTKLHEYLSARKENPPGWLLKMIRAVLETL